MSLVVQWSLTREIVKPNLKVFLSILFLDLTLSLQIHFHLTLQALDSIYQTLEFLLCQLIHLPNHKSGNQSILNLQHPCFFSHPIYLWLQQAFTHFDWLNSDLDDFLTWLINQPAENQFQRNIAISENDFSWQWHQTRFK